jgi:hypothetical protein
MRLCDGMSVSAKSGMEATTRCAFRGRWGEGCSGVVLQHHRYQRTRELDVLNWSGSDLNSKYL